MTSLPPRPTISELMTKLPTPPQRRCRCHLRQEFRRQGDEGIKDGVTSGEGVIASTHADVEVRQVVRASAQGSCDGVVAGITTDEDFFGEGDDG